MTSSSFDSLLSSSQADIEKAMARHALISNAVSQLSRQAPAPSTVHDFGYCANVSLIFEATPESALAIRDAYPPQELVFVDGNNMTVKPRSYLRNQDAGSNQFPAGPYLVKASKTPSEPEVCWWSELSGGLMAQITLRKAGRAIFDSAVRAPGYVVDTQAHATGQQVFGVRALAPAPDAAGPMAQWYQEWELFALNNRYTSARIRALRNVCSRMTNSVEVVGASQDEPNTAWIAEGLPLKPTSLLSPKTSTMQGSEPGPDPRGEGHWLNRGVQFWRHFDDETAAGFWEFCLHMASTFTSAKAADKAFAQEAVTALEVLMKQGTPSISDSKTWERMVTEVRHKLQRYVDLRIRHSRYGKMDLEVRTRKEFRFPEYYLTAQSNESRRLLAQDVPARYVA